MRLLFLSVFFAACSNGPPAPPPTVDPPVVACNVPSDAGTCDPFATPDADADGGTCDAGAPAGDPCALPPSVCADSHWAAYFDNGVCGADGKCELVTKYHYCETGCLQGACIQNGPTFAGRGF